MTAQVNFADARELVAADFEVVSVEAGNDGMVDVLFFDDSGYEQIATVYYNDNGELEYFA